MPGPAAAKPRSAPSPSITADSTPAFGQHGQLRHRDIEIRYRFASITATMAAAESPASVSVTISALPRTSASWPDAVLTSCKCQ